MPYFDTLEYVDAGGAVQEVALKLANIASAGAVQLEFNPRSHAVSTLEITWPLPPETALVIPFRSRCKVRVNRSSADGSANSFTAGTILFQGRRTDNNGSANAHQVSTHVTISDAWWDLEHVTYTLPWRYISGGTMASPTYSTYNWPDIVLFQASPGTTYSPAAINNTISTWQQLQAIMDFAANYATGDDAVQLQLAQSGTLASNVWTGGTSPEFSPAYLNWYPVRSAKCGECINMCLRPHPQVFTEFDYSTTPPTLHFRSRTNLAAVTLPYKSTDSAGIIHVASGIKPLPELKPDAVRLFYKISGTYNGQPIVSYSNDNYPSATSRLLSLDFSIDIAGAGVTETRYTFVSASFDPTSKTLWRQRVASLKQLSEGGQIPNDGGSGALAFVDANPYNSSTHPKGIQVIGDDGTDYSASYGTLIPCVSDMDLYSWMTLSGGGTPTVVKATVKAFFSYDKISPQGGASAFVKDTFGEHQHSFRVLLTNAPSGTYVLRQTVAAGESIPYGLAQSIYTELQAMQWKLRHDIFQVAADDHSLPVLVKPGKHKVNLAGGHTDWTTMNAVPENVVIRLFRTGDNRLAAQTSITCGPVNHLEPGYLVQLHNLFWNRSRSGIDANQRLTGSTASNQVDLSATIAKENSLPSEPVPQITNHVYVDNGGNVHNIRHNAQELYNINALN